MGIVDVLRPIRLYDDAALETDEVDDVGLQDDLSPESIAR
jgi:hypothetical protein